MNEATILLGLRMVAGIALLAFMGGIAYMVLHESRLGLSRANATPIRGRLVVLTSESNQPVQGQFLPLAPATTLGRAPTNTIQIDDRFASSLHARVFQRMGQWWLEDHHSSNGTRLNGILIEEAVVLAAGDVISIGAVQLRLELE